MLVLVSVLTFISSSMVRHWMTFPHGKWSQVPIRITLTAIFWTPRSLTRIKVEVSKGMPTEQYIPGSETHSLVDAIQ